MAAAGTVEPCASPSELRDFLKASHFSVGHDARLHRGFQQSRSHQDFPAHAQVVATRPAPTQGPPPLARLLQVDARWADQEHVAETRRAFPPPPLPSPAEQERAPIVPGAPLGHAILGTGGRTVVPSSRATYGWPELPTGSAREHIRGARLLFARDSVPSGDPDKLRFPFTTYRALFPPYDVCPQPPTPCYHLGEMCCTSWGRESRTPAMPQDSPPTAETEPTSNVNIYPPPGGGGVLETLGPAWTLGFSILCSPSGGPLA